MHQAVSSGIASNAGASTAVSLLASSGGDDDVASVLSLPHAAIVNNDGSAVQRRKL
jgi:hypothetical protein